jgi:threonine/homoserine/homoserine lactone efflux protein
MENTMIPPLPDWPLLTVFLFASFVLAVTPGPGVLYIVTRSVTQGRRSGLASVAGVALGNLGNALATSLGLAALFSVSAWAFEIVKYAGAGYLVYLGLRTAMSRGGTRATDWSLAPGQLRRVFRDGLIVALFNPKTTLFFAAFLPQFIARGPDPTLQSISLGAIFVAVAAFTDTAYALAAGNLAPLLSRVRGIRTLGNYLAGTVYIGLGMFAAVSGMRDSK